MKNNKVTQMPISRERTHTAFRMHNSHSHCAPPTLLHLKLLFRGVQIWKRTIQIYFVATHSIGDGRKNGICYPYWLIITERKNTFLQKHIECKVIPFGAENCIKLICTVIRIHKIRI